jgi:uncharacterized protein (DUF1015 family)
MADIRPFRAIRYNTRDPLSVALVTAPPYDCISPAERDELLRTHPHNVVRLILGRPERTDTAARNVYHRAANLLEKWLTGGVLARDARPALYFYQQEFQVEGTSHRRDGFFARVGLEEIGAGRIFPHEETLPGPMEDRLRLLRATRANLSAVFALYPDETNEVAAVFHAAGIGELLAQTVDGAGVVHRLYACTDPATVGRVVGQMADRPLYIADGHHRYGTALAYRQEVREQAGSLPADHPANFVLMMCVSMSDPGLMVLPTHRVLSGLPDLSAARLRAATEEHFAWTEFVGAEATSPRLMDHLAAADGPAFGLWTRDTASAFLLRLRDVGVMDRLAPEHSAAWRRLDVAILRRLVLEGLLPKAVARPADLALTFVYLAQQAFDAVHEDGADAAFVLRPLPVTALQQVAAAGERMPPKSTYFYPKILSGLVLNPLAD